MSIRSPATVMTVTVPRRARAFATLPTSGSFADRHRPSVSCVTSTGQTEHSGLRSPLHK